MLPVGEGTLNWENIIRALKRVGFDGYFSLEWAHVDNSEKWAKESQLYVKKLIDTIEP